jgi:hypothetical protein
MRGVGIGMRSRMRGEATRTGRPPEAVGCYAAVPGMATPTFHVAPIATMTLQGMRPMTSSGFVARGIISLANDIYIGTSSWADREWEKDSHQGLRIMNTRKNCHECA